MRVYGQGPLHLLGQLVAFAIAAYAFSQVVDVASTDKLSLLIWFFAGALLHDLLFLPIYLVLDMITRLGIRDRARHRVRSINHIRFPVAISAVMFFTTFPMILGKNEATYLRTTGEQTPDYLGRWLLITAIVFAISALAYAVRLRRKAQGGARTGAPAGLAAPAARHRS